MEGFGYVYNAPASSKQREHIARVVEEKRRLRHLKSVSSASEKNFAGRNAIHFERRVSSLGEPHATACDGAISRTKQSKARNAHADLILSRCVGSEESRMWSYPFDFRHGRRHLGNFPYPLPVDVAEMHRQKRRTMLASSVFGGPICSPSARSKPLRKVLEVGCGGAYWTGACHKFLRSQGVKRTEFVGLDIAPVAANLNWQGVPWTFVQHDMRRLPLPFADGVFDLVMLKDLSLTLSQDGDSSPFESLVDDCVRLLREGGTLEIWDGEHLTRAIPPGGNNVEHDVTARADAISVGASIVFEPTPNHFFEQANDWIKTALQSRGLPASPRVGIGRVLRKKAHVLGPISSRLVAVPLAQPGCRGNHRGGPSEIECRDSVMSHTSSDCSEPKVTNGQRPLRRVALLSVVHFVQSLKPELVEVSGMDSHQWNRWWTRMMADLVDGQGAANGECLELGAWWATKLTRK